MSGAADLLDRLARRSAETGGWLKHAQSASETGARSAGVESAEGAFSRVSALKLAAAGGASFFLGLRNAPVAGAQTITRGQCFDLCLDGADLLLKQKGDACADLFLSDVWLEKSEWKVIKKTFRYGPYSFGWDVWSAFPHGVCVLHALNQVRQIKNDCLDQCEETCRPRRSLQSASAPTAPLCEVKPPPKSKPPETPPSPSAAERAGYCSTCPERCEKCPKAPEGAICCAGSLPEGTCCQAAYP